MVRLTPSSSRSAASGRGRQLGAGDEEVVLEAEDVGGQLGLLGAAEGAGDAELRAGLVERAVGLGAAVVLGDAAAVPERGGPVVALLGVDLDHGPILRRRGSADRVEDHPGHHLGEEVGRLRRHVLVGLGDGADLLDRDRALDEGDVEGAVLELGERVGDALGVLEPARSSMSSSLIPASPSAPASRGSPSRGGGRPPACPPAGGPARRCPSAAAGRPACGSCRRGRRRRRPSSPAGSSSSTPTSVDLEQLAQAAAEAPLALGVGGEAGEQAVGGEDGEAGVVEAGQRHQRVVVRALAADLVAVGARGLVAVVAVGDQQLGAGEALGDGGVDRRVADPPDPVDGAVVVGGLAPGLAAERRLDQRPGVLGAEREDRREVVAGGPGQLEPVLQRARVGALVGADAAGLVVLDPDPGEDAVAAVAGAVGRGVVLGQRPDRRLASSTSTPSARQASIVLAASS